MLQLIFTFQTIICNFTHFFNCIPAFSFLLLQSWVFRIPRQGTCLGFRVRHSICDGLAGYQRSWCFLVCFFSTLIWLVNPILIQPNNRPNGKFCGTTKIGEFNWGSPGNDGENKRSLRFAKEHLQLQTFSHLWSLRRVSAAWWDQLGARVSCHPTASLPKVFAHNRAQWHSQRPACRATGKGLGRPRF